MTLRDFATIGVRLLGVAAILVGVVFAGSSGIMRALGAAARTSTSISDLHLHNVYYVFSHVEDTWLAPGVVSGITGVLLLVFSRGLGACLARGTDPESRISPLRRTRRLHTNAAIARCFQSDIIGTASVSRDVRRL